MWNSLKLHLQKDSSVYSLVDWMLKMKPGTLFMSLYEQRKSETLQDHKRN